MEERRKSNPAYPPKPLEEAFLGGPLKKMRIEEPIYKPSAKVDLERIRRRLALIDNVDKRFREKSLDERLATLNIEASDIAQVLRLGLLGFLPDETPIVDFIPQGEGNMPTDRINQDPLWAGISEKLEYYQIGMVNSIFKSVERLSEKLNDEQRALPAKTALGKESLLTMGDLRSVPSDRWLRISGLGEKSARVLFEATRKIEE